VTKTGIIPKEYVLCALSAARQGWHTKENNAAGWVLMVATGYAEIFKYRRVPYAEIRAFSVHS